MSITEHDHTVLVVEDDRGIADLISLVLEDAGFTVYTEAAIAEGLKSFADHNPSVIITDLMLPDGLGTDLILQARRRTRNNQVSSILISAHPQALAHATASRADAYLAKPFDLDDLSQLVAGLVG